MTPLPGPIIEAENGMMLILFAAMLVSAFAYFCREVFSIRAAYSYPNVFELVRIVYIRSKASWAATILFLGLFVRTGDLWLVRYIQNHGGDATWLDPWATVVVIASGVPIIWGAICWMRAVLPLRCWPGTWAVLAAFAIGFGIYMASG